ncbi:hypothetical protein FA15DRAFT_660373 [Coprinopsis marcescibilis]|uniref:Uncharacterized protein n=1 Tax=Coprinopsis marcescibilis TaxID=230819 RepID=A0A5C3KGD4_COPMA|nr:hypothetical protein FA15DRAFT_660373 [Coprinopsis marcescibilis]
MTLDFSCTFSVREIGNRNRDWNWNWALGYMPPKGNEAIDLGCVVQQSQPCETSVDLTVLPGSYASDFPVPATDVGDTRRRVQNGEARRYWTYICGMDTASSPRLYPHRDVWCIALREAKITRVASKLFVDVTRLKQLVVTGHRTRAGQGDWEHSHLITRRELGFGGRAGEVSLSHPVIYRVPCGWMFSISGTLSDDASTCVEPGGHTLGSQHSPDCVQPAVGGFGLFVAPHAQGESGGGYAGGGVEAAEAATVGAWLVDISRTDCTRDWKAGDGSALALSRGRAKTGGRAASTNTRRLGCVGQRRVWWADRLAALTT